MEQVRERLLAEGGAITDTRIATAVRETLGVDLDQVVAQWRAWMTR